jgi:hypothetical protein
MDWVEINNSWIMFTLDMKMCSEKKFQKNNLLLNESLNTEHISRQLCYVQKL